MCLCVCILRVRISLCEAKRGLAMVDDVEFLFSPNGKDVEIRSSSRTPPSPNRVSSCVSVEWVWVCACAGVWLIWGCRRSAAPAGQ